MRDGYNAAFEQVRLNWLPSCAAPIVNKFEDLQCYIVVDVCVGKTGRGFEMAEEVDGLGKYRRHIFMVIREAMWPFLRHKSRMRQCANLQSDYSPGHGDIDVSLTPFLNTTHAIHGMLSLQIVVFREKVAAARDEDLQVVVDT